MDVAVAIGTEPALTFSAIVPAPPDVEEFIIAGFLRQKPVELVKCETVDLEVPLTPRSFSKATSTSTSSAPKARSETTLASTRSKTNIPSFMSPASHIAKTRSTRPQSSASLRRKTPGWAKLLSESSFRS